MHELRATTRYCGRFAPSPTGPLHFGSLVAAVGSYLEARHRLGTWLLRIEDLDGPRCQPGAIDSILRTLDAFGFEWDGEMLLQSQRDPAYRAAFESLRATGTVFPCACSRKEMADSQLHRPLLSASDGAQIYPGTCRAGLPPGREIRAWRMRVDDTVIGFEDMVQGMVKQRLAVETGDFILLRADGLFAYQLAVVVDDAEQGVTHVVRGADLLDSTPRQMLLQRALGVSTPVYAHLPVAVNTVGQKLSKQTQAAALDTSRPQVSLLRALQFLGQTPPDDLAVAKLDDFWHWAKRHWDLAKVPRQRAQLASR